MQKHKITLYLGAPFGDQGRMKQYRAALQKLGYQVRACWIDEPAKGDFAVDGNYLRRCAEKDVLDLWDATHFVVFPGHGAGHHTEFGLALARGIKLIVVGKKNNIFHYIKEVVHYETEGDFWVAAERGEL